MNRDSGGPGWQSMPDGAERIDALSAIQRKL